MKGRITKSTGSWYEVLADHNKKYSCRVRGKFRLDEIKESNPVAVGDYVIIELEKGIGSITKILPRQNHILRQSVKKTGHASVLAANVDQVMLVATLKQPRTSWGFIDRFLVSAESENEYPCAMLSIMRAPAFFLNPSNGVISYFALI